MSLFTQWSTALAAIALGASCAPAQMLQVYSEFARLDATGKVLAPETPREILSPALVRNGFTSFQIAINVGRGEHWRLFVGQNPENAVQVTMYREVGQRLDKVDLPLDGDGPAALWMDVWTASEAPVARIKIEPQLDYRQDWTIYPIEGRVMEAKAGNGASPAGTEEAAAVIRQACSPNSTSTSAEVPTPPSGPPTIARMHDRNARQDLTLAAKAPREEFSKLACGSAGSDDPESYLRIRDYLLRLR